MPQRIGCGSIEVVNYKIILPLLFGASLGVAGCAHFRSAGSGSTMAEGEGGLPPLTAMKGTGRLVDSGASRYRFAVFGDSQGGEKARAVTRKIFESIRDHQPAGEKPEFAFCLGDIVKGKDPQDPALHIRRKFREYLELAKTAGLPVFNAPGNHEMDDAGDIPSERMHRIYREEVAPSYGAFDYGNARFIGLNTEDVPPSGTHPPPKGMEFSYLGDRQFRQLDADLAANQDKAHIFIMMHYPMKAQRPQDRLNPESRRKLSRILAKYDNISFVFASHEHVFYNPRNPGNTNVVAPFTAGEATRYLVSGGAGAKIWVAEEKGGFHHYLLVEVEGEKVSVVIKRVGD